MTEADGVALAGLCQSYARWKECEKVISDEGLSYETHSAQGGRMVRPRPEVKMAQVYLSQVRAFCTEFGLTPSSRGRMTVPGAGDEGECPKCSMPMTLCGCG